MNTSPLFPKIEPYRSGHLPVSHGHSLYWEECGNPLGVPVLFLHGGPGAGLSTEHRRFFDPAYYRIVLFEQRGAGRSTPHGEYRHNTTQLLIEDIETLRALFEIDQWLIFGGSWGSTLALAYGQAHPQACTGFILRGIFLCTSAEVEWFIRGISWFYPDAYAEFAAAMPEEERGDLLQAYSRRLFSDDPAVYTPAARSWSRYENSCLTLLPRAVTAPVAASEPETVNIGLGRLEAHYMQHAGFMEEDQLIRQIDRIRHLPAVIVQGRYDVICPPTSAFRLHQAWPESRLQLIPDAGHSAFETGIASALVAATEQFKEHRKFG